MSKPLVEVVKMEHAKDFNLPKYATVDSAGLDLQAAIEDEIYLDSLERVAVPTGLKIALPAGFEAQIRPRSGMALKQGVTVLNTPGTIDSDYRGEIKVILVNLSKQPVRILRGDRIAQMVVAEVVQAELTEVETLDTTVRGEGGFGSTGR
jgi:dUTP pyrophosphatase